MPRQSSTDTGGRTDRIAHWAHGHHLIPRRWLNWACDRYDRRPAVTESEIRRTP